MPLIHTHHTHQPTKQTIHPFVFKCSLTDLDPQRPLEAFHHARILLPQLLLVGGWFGLFVCLFVCGCID
jgi:hypothetical protein